MEGAGRTEVVGVGGILASSTAVTDPFGTQKSWPTSSSSQTSTSLCHDDGLALDLLRFLSQIYEIDEVRVIVSL